ncbi:uncharacterized protein TRUGW13939_10298, partial [Talaromyces rugulosus]
MLKLKGKDLSWAIWLTAGCAISTFGFNQSALGNLVRLPSFYGQFPDINAVTSTGPEKEQKSRVEGTVVALYTLFGAFGGLGCMPLGDILGRKKTIWLSSFVQGIGYIIMATSYSLPQLIVSRMVLGLGTGGLIATVSVWQAELSKSTSRGAHVSAFGTFAGFGGAVALWTEYGMSFVNNSSSWRLPLALPIVFSIAVASFMCLLPESPHWLIKTNKVIEAEAILAQLGQGEESLQQTVHDIQMATHVNGNVRLSALWEMGPRRVFHRVCLACGVQFFLQLNGTNAVVYYATTIFQAELHFSQNLSLILSACLPIAIIVAALICSFTVDRFGRRKLMIFGAIMSSLCMACLTGTTSQPANSAALKAAVFFVYAFKFFFTIGWLGIPFLYATEIAPDGLRASVSGIATATGWLFNFLIVEVSPIAFTKIGEKYFIVFTVMNVVSALTIYFFYPETAGCTLEEIDAIFIQSKSIFDTVKVARQFPRRLDPVVAPEPVQDKPGSDHA